MPVIRARRAGVRLTIVGSHPPREVRALARDNVVVTGRVPAVEPYLEQAAVVVAPVRMGGGMRLKVLQAMALGKAVVTTSIGAEGLAVGADRPPLAIADETAGFAGAVTRLLADEAERRVLGQSARAFVAANHSWSAYAERLEAMYSCLTVTSRAERRS
jgi:glycosyltransferase involved in cell wall biosynthesis